MDVHVDVKNLCSTVYYGPSRTSAPVQSNKECHDQVIVTVLLTTVYDFGLAPMEDGSMTMREKILTGVERLHGLLGAAVGVAVGICAEKVFPVVWRPRRIVGWQSWVEFFTFMGGDDTGFALFRHAV